MTDRVRVTFILDAELVDSLDRAADERVISRSLLVTKLIEHGLDNLAPVSDFVRDSRS